MVGDEELKAKTRSTTSREKLEMASMSPKMELVFPRCFIESSAGLNSMSISSRYLVGVD
jgi:hypothetical protein